MKFDNVFAALNIINPTLIGEGQESVVYDLHDGRVLKLLKNANTTLVANEQRTYERLAVVKAPFRFPRIIEFREIAGTKFILEEKLPGIPLSTALEQTTDKESRRTLLCHLVEVTKTLREITFTELPYGDLISCSPQHHDDWIGHFTNKVQAVCAKNQTEITEHSPLGKETLTHYLTYAEKILGNQTIPKSFVHGDLWPPNILVDGTTITAIIDLNEQSLIGDSFIDLASLKTFSEKWLTPDENEYVEKEIIRQFGIEVTPILNLYIVYYAFLFAGTRESDSKAYIWAIGIIKDLQNYLPS